MKKFKEGDTAIFTPELDKDGFLVNVDGIGKLNLTKDYTVKIGGDYDFSESSYQITHIDGHKIHSPTFAYEFSLVHPKDYYEVGMEVELLPGRGYAIQKESKYKIKSIGNNIAYLDVNLAYPFVFYFHEITPTKCTDMKEENYFILDGKKIPMSKETAESLRETQKTEESQYATFVDDVTKMTIQELRVFGGDMEDVCQIGFGAVPDDYKGRCLLLYTEKYDWKIIDNQKTSETKLLIAKKK